MDPCQQLHIIPCNPRTLYFPDSTTSSAASSSLCPPPALYSSLKCSSMKSKWNLLPELLICRDEHMQATFYCLRVPLFTWWNCSRTIIPSPCLCWVNQLLLCLPAHLLLTFKTVSSSRTSIWRELLNGLFPDQTKCWPSRSSCPPDPSFCWIVLISSKAQSSFTMGDCPVSQHERILTVWKHELPRFGIFALLQLLMCNTDHMKGANTFSHPESTTVL